MEDAKYIMLKKRIETLKNNFNFEQKEEGVTPEQEDLIRAFLLLCHAEIENYIEDLATDLLNNGIEKWNQDKLANYNLASLFMWYNNNIEKRDIFEKAEHIFGKFRKIIKENHGIKEQNIKKLFVPLGYSIDDFDTDFMSEINSWGTLRGEVAHKSAKQTTAQLNFEDEVQKVGRIVGGLDIFRKKLYEYVVFDKDTDNTPSLRE